MSVIPFTEKDAKIQDVLGHFQKDFEGGVSAENVGAKFGGYGSFLPAYQRSPSIRSQPRSPFKARSQNVPKPPDNQSFENHTVQMSASISKSCTASTLQPQESSCKKDKCMNVLSVEVSNLKRGSIDKPADGGDQKILKVRIKVGTDNISARNNAATLYSGLGLDFSPFSSPEDSHGHSGVVYLGLQDLLHELPQPSFR